MFNAALLPVPTVLDASPTKRYPPLDVRSTVSKPLSQKPTTLLVAVPSKTSNPDDTNTPVDPTEAFKNIFSDITESLPFLISTISYEPRTMFLQLEDVKQGLIIAAATYKAAVPHQKKALLLDINVPIKFLTHHL